MEAGRDERGKTKKKGEQEHGRGSQSARRGFK